MNLIRIAEPKVQLVRFAQRLRVEIQIAQRLRKVRSETVQRINFPRRDLSRQFDQVVEVSMVAQRKSSVTLIAEPATRIKRPTGDHGRAHAPKLGVQRASTCIRWHD